MILRQINVFLSRCPPTGWAGHSAMQSSRDPGHDPDPPEAPPPLAYIAWFGLLVGCLRLPPLPLFLGGRTLTITPNDKETFKKIGFSKKVWVKTLKAESAFFDFLILKKS